MKKRTHAFIPDTQVKPNVPTEHITAAGNYLADKQPDIIVCIGDWWDMPSLSTYDKAGSKGWEDKDVSADFEAGCDAMSDFLRPIQKAKGYNPKLVFTMGNHEDRVRRAREDPENRRFKGFLKDDQFRLKEFGFKVVPFLKPINIDGILYCHYFTGGVMDRPLGGQVETRLKNLCHSFSMGHQQMYQVGVWYTGTGERIRGLVNGTFYQHDEEYVSTQGNARTWRGILLKHEVHKGNYDLMEVSMEYLLENWQ